MADTRTPPIPVPDSVRDLALGAILRKGARDWPVRVSADLSPAPLGIVSLNFDPRDDAAEGLHFAYGRGRESRRAAFDACLLSWRLLLRNGLRKPGSLAALVPFFLLAPLHLPLFVSGGAVFARLKPLESMDEDWPETLRLLLLLLLSFGLVVPTLLLGLPAFALHEAYSGHIDLDEPSAHERLEHRMRTERRGRLRGKNR